MADPIEGKEGSVWKVRFRSDPSDGQLFALKTLTRQIDDPFRPLEEEKERWHDVVRTTGAISSPHIVNLRDIFWGPPPHPLGAFTDGDPNVVYSTPYFLMDWVPGRTMREHVQASRRGDSSLIERFEWVRQLADALTSIHSSNGSEGNPLLHRDIKPDNCIIDPEVGAVLVDILSMRRTHDEPHSLHTRQYAAPEVIVDPLAPRDTSTDCYSLGALAYFCVVGDDPEVADEARTINTARETIVRHARTHGAARPTQLADQIVAAMAFDPRCRRIDISNWAHDLVATVAIPRARYRRSAWVVGAVGAAATLALSAGGVWAVASLWGGDDRSPSAQNEPDSLPKIGSPPPLSAVPIVAYNNWESESEPIGHPMCTGNPRRPESLPGGTVTQSFTVPENVGAITAAKVQIDQQLGTTADASLTVGNGSAKRSVESSESTNGDTVFNFKRLPVRPNEKATLSIRFRSQAEAANKLVTVYSMGSPGGDFAIENSCQDGAESINVGDDAQVLPFAGLRAVIEGDTG